MFFFKSRHPWLISERGTDARDNGYWMFLYLQEIKKQINSYFVIDKKSPDCLKLTKYKKNVIQKGSLKHWLMFIAADVRMATHLFLFAPVPYVGEFIKHHHTRKTINVDLQHGITHNTFPSNYKNINGSDLYICGAKPEYEWVKNNFGWDDKSIKYTGFARFDGLHNITTKKQILIMPTWRSELRDKDEKSFLESSYYKNWQSLISKTAFIDLIKNYGYSCIFYVHFSLQKFSHLFKANDESVVIAAFDKYDVQKLLKESSILVTDYSSVFFDFAYMKKPLIYYQFDYNDFYSKHYQNGFFNHEKNGFGKVCYKENEVVDELKNILLRNCEVEDKYKKRVNGFFELYDTNNCERIYNAIVNRKLER